MYILFFSCQLAPGRAPRDANLFPTRHRELRESSRDYCEVAAFSLRVTDSSLLFILFVETGCTLSFRETVLPLSVVTLSRNGTGLFVSLRDLLRVLIE